MSNKFKSLLAGAALMLSFAVVAPPVSSAHEGHDRPKKKSKKKAIKRAHRARAATTAARQADGHTHKH